jgi:hypothetical protein
VNEVYGPAISGLFRLSYPDYAKYLDGLDPTEQDSRSYYFSNSAKTSISI